MRVQQKNEKKSDLQKFLQHNIFLPNLKAKQTYMQLVFRSN